MAIPSWLTLNKTSGSGNAELTYTATENTGRDARRTTLTFSASGVSSISQIVSQSGKSAFVDIESTTYTVDNKKQQLNVAGTSNCKRLYFSISSGGEHITMPLKYRAAGQDTLNDGVTLITGDPGATTEFAFGITLTIEANSTIETRTCQLLCIGYVDSTEVTDVCDIKQSPGAASLSVSPTTVSFESTTGTRQVTVTSNTSWQVS